MSTNKLPKIVRENIQVILIGFVLIILLVGTFVAVRLSQLQQENRQQASTNQGVVVIDAAASQPLNAGQPGTITFSINTNNLPISGAQIKFQLNGVSADPGAIPTMETITGVPLSFFKQVSPSNNGYLITLSGILTPTDPPSSWDTNGSPVELVKLHFTASNVDPNVTLSYVQAESRTTVNNDPNQDDLRTLVDATFPITQNVIPTDTPLVTDSIQPSPTSALPTDTPMPTDVLPSPTNAPNPTETPANPTPTLISEVPTSTPVNTATPIQTATPIPTATPDTSGSGGTTYKYCGESCTAHSDCAVNLLCYTGVCRLANNPTDTSCNQPPDNGIHRACNEYCADSRECQTGLTCYYNSCRNPRNVSDQYCANPIVYNTRVINKTVVATATPEPTDIPQDTPVQDNGLFGNTDSQASEILPSDTPWPTYAPVAETTPEPVSDEFSMADRIQSWLKGLLIVAVAISAVFFLLWLLPIFLKRRREDDDDDQPPMPMAPPSGTSDGGTPTSPSSPYSDSLRDKTTMGMG